MTNHPSAHDQGLPAHDIDMIAHWVRLNPVRLIAGALGGVFSSWVALIFAMILLNVSGGEPTYAPKLLAAVLLGSEATEISAGMGTVVTGVVLLSVLCAFLGAVFSHFVYTNKFKPMLMMGLVWGTFSWIFIWCLFLPSFNAILWAKVSAGPVFFVCLLFGAALTSIRFIYSALGGKSA